MKQIAAIAGCIAIVTGVICFLNRPEPSQISEGTPAKKLAIQSSRFEPRPAPPEIKSEESDLPPEPAAAENLPEISGTGVASSESTIELATHAIASVTQTVAEFSYGQRENIVLGSDGLSLGTETSAAKSTGDYQLAGVFHSQEQTATEPFTFFKADYQGTVPAGTAVSFEIRTKSAEGNWSDWRALDATSFELSQMLDFPSVGWQYRLSLFANDIGASPKIHNVTISPEKTVPVAVSQNGATTNPEPQSAP